MKEFSTIVQLQNYIEKNCRIAVERACNRLLGTLQEIIETEYYDQYEPEYYDRTMQFWKSATTEMLSNTTGQILMNPNAMKYKKGWTGEIQIETANEGLHGGYDVGTSDHRYWDKFLEFCDKNAVKILKEELRKVGIAIT